MNLELKKRIITSLILFPILLLILVYSKIFLIIFLTVLYLLCVYEVIKNSKSFIFSIIANLFLFASFYFFYLLRGDTFESLIFLCWAIFSTFLTDIGGYVFGKTFKGKKLTKVSPNKTYSGSIGSFIFSLISIPILNYFQELILNQILIDFFQSKYFILTLVVSLIAQIGDIFISFWKRKFNIKDTSNLLPGHGGILDRIDGLIFVIFFIFLTKFLSII